MNRESYIINQYTAVFFALFALAMFLVPLFSADAAVIRRAPNNLGLVGYWSFDDARGSTATDFSGNGNAVTLTNMDPGSDWVAGKKGGALDFDGSDDYGDINDAWNYPLTISMWVKPGSGDDQVLFDSGFSYNDDEGVLIKSRDDNAYGFLVFLGSDFKSYDFGLLEKNIWQHLVVTIDASREIEVFKNATSKGTRSADKNSLNNFKTTIGAEGGSANYADAQIDEVRIYDRALSSSEIKDLYNAGGYAERNATSDALYPDKLVSHWSMDGPDVSGSTVKDVHGSSDGAKNGDPIAERGILGQAISFDGDGDWIDVPNGSAAKSVIDNGTDFTVSVWGRIDDLESDNSLVMTDEKTSGAQFILWRDESGSGFGRTNTVSVFVNGSVGGTRVEGESGTWNDRKWKHITATYDSQGKLRLYVNGKEDPNSPVDNVGALNSNSNPIRFGADTNGNYQANGETDDIRIYDEALNANEVSRLYTATKPDTINSSQNQKLTNGLVGMWSFDGQDLSGSTAEDVSGNGNDGTLNSDPQPTIGRIGQALDFNDSNNDHINVSNTPLPQGTSDYTVSAWFKARKDTGDIFYWGTGEPSKGTGIIIRKNPERVGHALWDNGLFVNQTYADGSWHHLAGTHDNSKEKIYLYFDGKRVASSTENPDIGSNFAAIGTNDYIPVGPVNSMDGKIDNVRIYDRALSENEIKRLYRLGQ